MKKFHFLILLLFGILKANAQTSPYGQVDTADLKLTLCSFEKGANAMVLFDVGRVTYDDYNAIIMERHKRIKIFNDKGADQANIRLEFWGANRDEQIKDIQAETINLVNNNIEVTVLDPKLIYTEKVDKQRRAKIFTMPNIKPGSVIDIKYTLKTEFPYNYPAWLFQDLIPTRYSELNATLKFRYALNAIKKIKQRFVTDTIFAGTGGQIRHVWALNNIHGFRVEPYMTAIEDNLQGIYFKSSYTNNTWTKIGADILLDEDFGGQLNAPLLKEKEFIADVNDLKTNAEKIAFIFNTVKNSMKWNLVDHWYTDDGIKKAWLNKTGNSTEINLILYHLLNASGIKSSLLVLGTRDNGEIEIDNASYSRLNKTVVQVPIDSGYYYVLDASGKYNTYNDTPYELLGVNMLTIIPGEKKFEIIKLKTDVSSKEIVLVNAVINSLGKMDGTVQISSSNYKRTTKLVIYDKLGEQKYIEKELGESNSNLHLSNFKLRNIENDTLPLREDFDFKLNLTGSDDSYIYFNPNLFTGVSVNPFLSESRLSDIDFVYLNNYAINGRYTLPPGYKVDALPKSMTIMMPDKSIIFKRTIGEVDGIIIVHYVIDFRKVKYGADEYQDVHDFYKKMHEMINEQVVLKKS